MVISEERGFHPCLSGSFRKLASVSRLRGCQGIQQRFSLLAVRLPSFHLRPGPRMYMVLCMHSVAHRVILPSARGCIASIASIHLERVVPNQERQTVRPGAAD